ncbi:hypothetical protein ACFVXG_15585 [Kitasatospora sp. NPDC058162]|uniref:hypothetical protein n=1 Tax=Kitasatospora sp. NPDC058162 TaxID=3346362 RepID=UPI0036DE54B1
MSAEPTPTGAAVRRDPQFTLEFRDNLQTAVLAGSYEITARQVLEGIDTGDFFPVQKQRFEVHAPQFTLEPGLLHAVNPLPDTDADYATTLAHVTLTDPLLPWRRHIAPTAREAREPWLALLVFAAGELPEDPNASGLTRPDTVADLLDDATPGIWHAKIAAGQRDADPGAPIATVTIPGQVFTAVAPRTSELRHLIHVRHVRPDTGLRAEQLAEGDYSVVVANRLPDHSEASGYVAHLVSLEGCAHILTAADTRTLGPGELVRLVSLHTWAFASAPDEHGGFPGLVRNLLFTPEGAERDLLLRIPTPEGAGAPAAAARARLQGGWVPLDFRLETGEQSFAWYRGPLVCDPAQDLPDPADPAKGWTSAAELMVYLEQWGVFDASYAAAWTLGRALGLADADFSASLAGWHARARSRAAALAQRLAAAGQDPVRAAQALAPRAQGRRLETLASDGSAARLWATAGALPATAGETAPARRTGTHPAPGLLAAPGASHITRLLHQLPPQLANALREELGDTDDSAAQWLASLAHLHHLSFAHLVPDERALPPESLRFFYLDPEWIAAVQAGAASIGVTSSLDTTLARTLGPAARARAAATPAAGVLIRSALVPHCPGLLVRPYLGGPPDSGGVPIAVLRQDTLGPDTLLCLFEKVPDHVELAEPPEGLSFGIDLAPGNVPALNLRRLDPPIAQQIPDATFPQTPGATGLTPHLRADPAGRARILDLRPGEAGGLLDLLAARLAAEGQSGPAGEFGPAGLAIQLVNTPRRQIVRRPASAHTGVSAS